MRKIEFQVTATVSTSLQGLPLFPVDSTGFQLVYVWPWSSPSEKSVTGARVEQTGWYSTRLALALSRGGNTDRPCHQSKTPRIFKIQMESAA